MEILEIEIYIGTSTSTINYQTQDWSTLAFWLISQAQAGTDQKADVFLMSTLRGLRFNYPLTRLTQVRSESEKIINPDCVGAGANNKITRKYLVAGLNLLFVLNLRPSRCK